MKFSNIMALGLIVSACGTSSSSDAAPAADVIGTQDTSAAGDTTGDIALSPDPDVDAVPDVAVTPDADADSGTAPEADATEPDPAVCGAATMAYLAAAKDLDTCTTGSDCEWITHPVCGQGCFVAVNAAADRSALEAAWQSFWGGGCVPDPVVPTCCDIAPPRFGFGCSAGKCTPCSYECALDCECDKDAVGCDLPKCKSAQCDTLVAAVDTAVDQNRTCTVDGDCMAFEYPICGTFGCYQRAIATAAPIATLTTLAQAAQDAQCAPFNCGCGPAGPATCVNGACTLGAPVE